MYLKYFISIALGIFTGINLAYYVNFSTEIFVVSFVICIINFLIYKISKRRMGVYKNETSIFIAILFLFISTGILLGQYTLSKDISHKDNFYKSISHKDNFSGIIYDIKNTENSQQIFLNLSNESNKSDYNENNFHIKVITNKFPKYHIGQKLNLIGKIEKSKIILPEIENDKLISSSFDAERKNDIDSISGEMLFPKINILEENEDNFTNSIQNIFSKFKNLKNKFVEILDISSPRAVSSLSAGTTLGDSSLFSKKEIEDFRIAGISHIIVLSGFNITILIYFLGFIFLNLNISFKKRIIFTIFSIIIFVIFVGAGASIVRAAIMGSILLLANIFGRQYLAKQALFLSAISMMILNPRIAVSDISFHLSFLATFAILYLVPIFDKYKLFKIKENNSKRENENILIEKIRKNILEIFKITLAIQIILSPYIIFIFNKISIFGIISNILVISFIPIIMLFAFLIIFFYFIFPPISIFISYLSFIFCKYIFLISSMISSISFSKLEIELSSFSLILIYILIIFLLIFENKRLKIKRYLESE